MLTKTVFFTGITAAGDHSVRSGVGGTGRRGTIALELGMVVPLFVLLFMGGFTLTRVLVTKHRMVDAAAVTARGMALTGSSDPAIAHNLVAQTLGTEAALCGQTLTVTATVVPGPFIGGTALQIDVRCTLSGGFGVPALTVGATGNSPY